MVATNTPTTDAKPSKDERFKRNPADHKDRPNVYWDDTDDEDVPMIEHREPYLNGAGDRVERVHRVKASEYADFEKDLTRRRAQS